MGKVYSCFTERQQKAFNSLPEKRQKYVVLRGQGYSKADAYELAGYKEKQRGVGGYNLENQNPIIAELIDVMLGKIVNPPIYSDENAIAMVVDNKANSTLPIELQNAGAMSDEDAKRIQFYRKIVNGEIKSIKVTKTFDKDGNLTGKKVEETSDINMRIQARREMDRILGLNAVIDMGQVNAGDIKITIVDASLREEPKKEVDDQRGETIDGTTGDTENS